MKRIKLAVIGCGAVAEICHLPVLKHMGEFDIRYLVDVSEDRINLLKERLGIKGEPILDYQEVLSNRDIDAVMVLTPPKFHYKMVIDAANAGKHVFCEKPFAMNTQEAEEMIKVCNDNKVKLLVGFNFRFIPQFSKIKELIDKGFFGKLIGGHSTFFGNAFDWPSVSKFQYNKAEGGGALFEMGVHHIDLMNWFFGEANTIFSKVVSLNNNVVDDNASVFIQYKNGANCIVYTGWNKLSINTITVMGTDGYATASTRKNEVLYYRKDLVSQAPIRIKVKRLFPYEAELKYFHDLILNKNSSLMSAKEIINSVKVIEKAYESNKSGKLISMSG